MYATGQSMGAMTTIGMNIRHPDLFAADVQTVLPAASPVNYAVFVAHTIDGILDRVFRQHL